MDISSEYIEMRLAAEQYISSQLASDENSILISQIHYTVYCDVNGIITVVKQKDPDVQLCDLPRQDQLQDVAFSHLSRGDDTYSIFSLMIDFVDFANSPTELFTMEQLWLAYVMKEVFNKIWDGEDWIVVIA